MGEDIEKQPLLEKSDSKAWCMVDADWYQSNHTKKNRSHSPNWKFWSLCSWSESMQICSGFWWINVDEFNNKPMSHWLSSGSKLPTHMRWSSVRAEELWCQPSDHDVFLSRSALINTDKFQKIGRYYQNCYCTWSVGELVCRRLQRTRGGMAEVWDLGLDLGYVKNTKNCPNMSQTFKLGTWNLQCQCMQHSY